MVRKLFINCFLFLFFVFFFSSCNIFIEKDLEIDNSEIYIINESELEIDIINNSYIIVEVNQTLKKENTSSGSIKLIKPEIEEKNWYKPKPGILWQWQLSGDIDTTFDVDLYDVDLVETPKEIIHELHQKDIKVICYFSAGSWEEYREDADNFPREVLGKNLDGWADEKWLDVSNFEKFASIIESRLDLAVEKGCDGVEPDNIDGFENDNGFNLNYDDQLKYNIWLSKEAHERNLSIALKNDLNQVKDLIVYYDFVVNEECFYYEECDLLLPFIDDDKAVLGVEYDLHIDDFCSFANKNDFSWLKKNIDLDSYMISCN